MSKLYKLAVLLDENKKCGKWKIGPLPKNGQVDIPLNPSKDNAIKYTEDGLYVAPPDSVEGVKGKDGMDGRDGKDGLDGESIKVKNSKKKANGDVEVTFSDGSVITIPKSDPAEIDYERTIEELIQSPAFTSLYQAIENKIVDKLEDYVKKSEFENDWQEMAKIYSIGGKQDGDS